MVAKSYLKFFETREETDAIWVFDKHAGRAFKTSIKNVSVETWFYEGSGAHQGTEAWLSETEGAHRRSIQGVMCLQPEEPIGEALRTELLDFVSVQYLRSKEPRHIAAELQMDLLGMASRYYGRPWDPKIAAKVAQRHAKDIHVQELRRSTGVVKQTLLELAFSLVRRKTDPTFHTSDCPVAIYNNLPDGQWGFAAPGARGAQVYVPLGPDICLVMYDQTAYGKKPETLKCADPRFIEFCNTLQASRATRQVFSTKSDFSSTELGLRYIPNLGDKDRQRTTQVILHDTIATEPEGRLTIDMMSTAARRLRLGGEMSAFDQADFQE